MLHGAEVHPPQTGQVLPGPRPPQRPDARVPGGRPRQPRVDGAPPRRPRPAGCENLVRGSELRAQRERRHTGYCR